MNLERERASKAFGHVRSMASDASKERYGTLARKLSVLIRTSGLCQAVHFLKAKGKDDLRGAEAHLLNHVAEQLGRIAPRIKDLESLCSEARMAPTASYLVLTREALACARWYSRFAESELDAVVGGD